MEAILILATGLMICLSIFIIIWQRKSFASLTNRLSFLENQEKSKRKHETRAPVLVDTSSLKAIKKAQYREEYVQVSERVRDLLLNPNSMLKLSNTDTIVTPLTPPPPLPPPPPQQRIVKVIQRDNNVLAFDQFGREMRAFCGRFEDVGLKIMACYSGRWIVRNTQSGEVKVVRIFRPGNDDKIINPLDIPSEILSQ